MSGESRFRGLRSRALTAAIAGITLACGTATADSPKPTDARLWTAADLAAFEEGLARTEAPYTQILKGRTYGAILLRRRVSGDPELHVKLNDFFVVLSGEGEIKVGGRVTGERTIAPDEKRGQKLAGGTLYRVKRGDVLFVPANQWLQVLVAKGEVLRAIIIKTQ